ncbi:TPA: hypothetical protein G8N28_004258 [Salmonella enterica]|nr:hypothetical protein [Salmonella enterica]
MMSERMKQEGLLQGVTSAALRQHQCRGKRLSSTGRETEVSARIFIFSP